jgi:hypothetical protein
VTVTLTTPTAGATLTGSVAVDATYDGKHFLLATLTVDNVQVGAADKTQPISFTLDTTKLGDGSHALAVNVQYALASGAKRWQHSAPVTVTVKNATVTQPVDVPFPARGAFYYPWYPETWMAGSPLTHVAYHPDLGYYDSATQSVIDAHIKALTYAKANVAIYSWWGPEGSADPSYTHRESTILPLVLERTRALGSPLRWCIYYEKEGFGDQTVATLQSELAYVLSRYGNDPAYAWHGGKPMVFVYSADIGSDLAKGQNMLDRWKQAAGAWWYCPKVFSGYRTLLNQHDERRGVVLRVGGQSAAPAPSDSPMSTITAHDRQLAFVMPNMEHNNGKSTEEPIGAVTTGNRHMLVRVNRSGSRRPLTVDEPTPTVAGHGEMALVAFRNHGDAAPVELPAHTVCSGGHHHGLLVYNGNPGFVRSLEDAAGTVTGRDKQSLLVPYYSNGNARTAEVPLGTVTSKDREALVITDDDIDACLFRMLQWPELLAAQQMHRLPDGSPYRLEAKQKNKRGQFVEMSNENRVKMIGNAVSSPVATMLGSALAQSLMAA